MVIKPVLTGFAGRKALFDAECYPNYILLRFQDTDTGVFNEYRIDSDTGLDERKAAETYYRSLDVVVTFNGHGYDDHILDVAFKGIECYDIWNHGDQLIRSGGTRYSPFLGRGSVRKERYPLSIDLAQILRKAKKGKNGRVDFVFPSLKSLGNRFGYKHLQTLPIAPGTLLTEQQKCRIDSYNVHDINITRLALQHLNEMIEMRRVLSAECRRNLTSMAESKLAETIVATTYTDSINQRLQAEWDGEEEFEPFVLSRSRKAEWVVGGSDILSKKHSFNDPALIALLDRIRGLTLHWKRVERADRQIVLEKPTFSVKVKIADKTYSFGLGGLHSEDDPLILQEDATHALTDADVGSYYPGMIIEERIAPGHLDADIYCDVFARITERRLDAKAKKQKEIATGMKVAINSGGYGKLSDKYSPFCDPPKGAMVTINGQLILLRLIEALVSIEGVRVLSCNTDGLLIHHPRDKMEQIYAAMKSVREIYRLNKFDVVEVIRVCRVSCNEYVMSYRDPDTGEVQVKGRGALFNDGSQSQDLTKKTDRRIVKEAAINCLLFDHPTTDTIRKCRDLTMFLGYENLDKAWTHIEDSDGNHLTQNTNRWYESTNGTVLTKVAADGKRMRFAKMHGVVVVNDLPDQFPTDINYDHYVKEAQASVDAVLHPKQKHATRRKKKEKLTDEERDEWSERLNETEANVDWLITLDLNYYRDLYTGRVAHSHYESMRAALKALWVSGLGLSKADLVWCFYNFSTADDHFDSDDKCDNMLRRIDWIVENIVPMQKDVFAADDTGEVTVHVMDQEPGGGKTRKALKMIVTNGPKVYWWAINKITPLASERHTELMALAEATGVQVDFMQIHSEAKGRGTMKMRIDARQREIDNHPLKDEMIFVTIITHKTLIDHYLADVRGVMLIDEPVQVWEQQHFNFPASYRTIRELILPIGVTADYDSDLNATIDADTQAVRLCLTAEGCEWVQDELKKRDTVHSSYRWIIEQANKTSGRVFALAEHWNSLEDPDQDGGIDVLALLHPKHIAHFDQTWMMAAYFKELLVYQLWEELYDMQWVFAEIPDGWQRTVPLRDRVTLYYVLENRQVTDTYLTNKGDPTRRRAMAQAVKEFFGDAPFIWSVGEAQRETGDYNCLPTDVIGFDGHCHPAYLTPKANGINCYQSVHGAAWLGTIKLPSTLLEIIGRLWGKGDTKRMALIEYELYACLQFLTRINSRRFDSADQVRYVVADKVQADYISRVCGLRPESVLPLPMTQAIKANLDDLSSKGTGRKRTRTDEDMRETQRQKQAKRRAAKAAAAGREAGRCGRPRKPRTV